MGAGFIHKWLNCGEAARRSGERQEKSLLKKGEAHLCSEIEVWKCEAGRYGNLLRINWVKEDPIKIGGCPGQRRKVSTLLHQDFIIGFPMEGTTERTSRKVENSEVWDGAAVLTRVVPHRCGGGNHRNRGEGACGESSSPHRARPPSDRRRISKRTKTVRLLRRIDNWRGTPD